MQKIILDTNFLLYCLRNRVDLFGELNRIIDVNYKICILDKTLDELKKIKDGKLATEFAKKYFEIIQTKDGNVDNLLLKEDAIIATMDKELREKLKKDKKQVIILRQKKYFKFF
jgi:rRNA-processing protein FCF1